MVGASVSNGECKRAPTGDTPCVELMTLSIYLYFAKSSCDVTSLTCAAAHSWRPLISHSVVM